jgi:enoyl-CoA hydratase/carnithine racemase
MATAVELMTLAPADLAAPVPLWEFGVRAGDVGVAVIDGTVADWSAVASAVADDLAAAPAITIAVVRDGAARGVAGACDLAVAADDVVVPIDACDDGVGARDRRVSELVRLIARAPVPALVAAQLLRGSRIATESFAYSMLMSGADFRAWRARRAPRAVSEQGARVRVERTGAAWTIALSRPARHNAFDARMREQLCDALDAVATGPFAPVVLVGDGPSFCSGGDLDEFGTADDPVVAHVVRTGRSAGRRLARLADRLVVGVHGHCIGAGVELAAFARTVIAARTTTFALPELSIGLSLGAGGAVSIPARIGRQRTLELLLRAEPIDAATALRWGLVDELVEPGAVGSRCAAAAHGMPAVAA